MAVFPGVDVVGGPLSSVDTGSSSVGCGFLLGSGNCISWCVDISSGTLWFLVVSGRALVELLLFFFLLLRK